MGLSYGSKRRAAKYCLPMNVNPRLPDILPPSNMSANPYIPEQYGDTCLSGSLHRAPHAKVSSEVPDCVIAEADHAARKLTPHAALVICKCRLEPEHEAERAAYA